MDILATDPDDENGPPFDRNRRFGDTRDILTISSSLVTIKDLEPDPEYLKGGGQGKSPEIRLAHFSLREYLISEGLRPHSKLTIYHCNEKLANTFIAKTCLAYLLQFKQPGCISKSTRFSHPLCPYAAKYWTRHAQPDNDNDAALRRLIMALLQSENAVYSNWLELYNPDTFLERKCAPIYYTSMAGLARASQNLLEVGADVNAQGGEYGTALQAASCHHSIVAPAEGSRCERARRPVRHCAAGGIIRGSSFHC
jgi:hypothetical protein